MAGFRGIFPVVQTPFDEQGAVDESGLTRQVDFCRQAGAHGLVYPVLASEFQLLTDSERRSALERVLKAADGRIPVVAGVAAASAQGAAEYAAHAVGHGADAVIALPPYVGVLGPDDVFRYYEAISNAARRPVFLQDAPPGLPVPRIMELLQQIEHLAYVKEENEPSAHNISALIEGLGDACQGVFGGAWCRWMMSELARGAHGFMPSVEIVDVHVRIWDLFHAGEQAAARDLYDRLLPFINLGFCLGLSVIKELLVRRGIIGTAHTRRTGLPALDGQDAKELDIILDRIDDLLMPPA